MLLIAIGKLCCCDRMSTNYSWRREKLKYNFKTKMK